MPSGRALANIFIAMIAVYTLAESISPVGALPINKDNSEDILTGLDFLSIFIGSNPSEEEHLNYDINKKEAPRINNEDQLDIISDLSPEHYVTAFNRNPRSNKEDDKENNLKVDLSKSEVPNNDDLQAEGSSFYKENIGNDRLKNSFQTAIRSDAEQFEEDSPKIIGVRVTSSVAVGRGNNTPQIINPPVVNNQNNIRKKLKLNGLDFNFTNDNPTTWRPSLFRVINRDFYKGSPSNRHTISTLPGPLIGANEDYIQQQKEREINKKKTDIIHPYQKSIYQHNREVQRPRSYSYSSVINSFDDPKLTTANDWISTRAESVATESTAGYVTIINHGGDNRVDEVKELENKPAKIENTMPNVPSLPIVYSEPAKIYSEPAKIYSEPARVYGKPEKVYSEPAKIYSEPAKIYSEPSKIYSEPAKIYSEPAKIYSEPAKIYSQPAEVYHPLSNVLNQQDHMKIAEAEPLIRPELNLPEFRDEYNEKRLLNTDQQQQSSTNDTKGNGGKGRPGEQNYEVDESVSVMTNGRTHGVQDKNNDDGQKVGYVVEGRNFRKYRVEERTPDGFIVGEYGVVSHDDGSLRGVRYTADGTTNPRLIYDALMKFLSL